MPQRNVATNFTFEQQRQEINLLAADFWTQKGVVDGASTTYLKHDGSNSFTGGTLNVPNTFTISANSGSGTLTIAGNLDVTGTTTTVSTANLEVTDKNILIAKGSTSDAQADGAGITIDSQTDITFNFIDANDALVSSIGLEATTFVKAPRAQFTGAGNPTTGQGLELTAPDQNTGQIASYSRDANAYKELRLKGSSVSLYTGTNNALIGAFNSTGLTTTGDITLDSTDKKIFLSNDSDQYITANAASNYLVLGTANGERLRIDSSGNVNFGAEKSVAFPSGTGIQVYEASNPRIKLTNDATGNGATDGTQIYLSNVGDTIIDNKDGKDIIFHANAAEKFRIKNTTTGSFIGIGNDTSNSSIAATFQVIAEDGEADELYVAKFQNLEETAGRSYGVDIRAGSNGTDHGLRVKNRVNDTTQLLVRGDGLVGIGHAFPTELLSLGFADGAGGNSTSAKIEFRTPSRSKLAMIEGADDTSAVADGNARGSLRFMTRLGGSEYERMRITSDGKVGINITDNNTADLHVREGNTGAGIFRVGGGTGGGTGLDINYSNGGTTKTIIKQNYRATNVGAELSFDSGFITFMAGTLGTDERLRITTDKVMTSVDFKPDTHQQRDIGTSSNSFNKIYGKILYDEKGDLRNVPNSPLSGSHSGGYVLVEEDSGKCVMMGGDLTFQSASSGGPFGGGDVISVINASGSAITLNQGSGLTLYNTGDGTTGNRTLGARGMATVIYMYGGNVAYISGAQLT